jgi:hypothetical protein
VSATEADLGLTQMAFNAEQGLGGGIDPSRYENLLVRFMMRPHQSQAKSRAAGRPIFEDIEYVDIQVPGDRTSQIIRPINDQDKLKWPRHYELFKARGEEAKIGTPLEQWPPITPALVQELKHFGVETVEQLANLADSAAQNFMGIQVWVQKAQGWLIQAGDAAEAEKYAEEIQKRDDQIEALMARVEALETENEED